MSIQTFVQALKTCEAANGAGKKAVIQEALRGLSKEGRALMFYAMNPYYTYGVKKFNRPKVYADSDAPLSTIIDVLDQLRNRELTGDMARETVTMLLGAFTKETATYIERVIEKDLKAGFSPETYNKIWNYDLHKDGETRDSLPAWLQHAVYQVPVFNVMLADKCTDADEFEQYITFPCQADWKYDGERNIAIVKSDGITHISRSGLEAFHMNGLFDTELKAIRDYLGYDYVLDGERFASDWTDTMNAKKSGNDEAKARMFIRAFFIMPLSHWEAQKTDITMRKNRENIKKMLADLPNIKRITLSQGREVKDYQDMVAYCDEVTTPGFDGQPKGHEGLILKDWDATYAWDRTIAWCKVKKFYSADGRIVGFEPGRPKSKFAGTLGRINVVGYLEDGTRFECGVGSGIKTLKPKDDPDCPTRDEIWNNKEKFLGTTIELKYQEVSLAKGKTVHSLRFPTVFRFRDDKIVYDEE